MRDRVRCTLLAVMIVTGCGSPPAPAGDDMGDGGPVRFDRRVITAENRDCPGGDDAPCAWVRISYAEPIGGGSTTVRENIEIFLDHDLVGRMRGFVPEDAGRSLVDLDTLAALFLAQYRDFAAEFPDAPGGWYVELEAGPILDTDAVATLDITERAYTGGAHPNSRRRLVSFDVPTGELIGLADLGADPEQLRPLLERQLRLDRGLGPDDDLEAAGFRLADGRLPLTDNVGVVEDGLLFHWDPYEIAPYSMGPVDVLLPVEELDGVVDLRYW